MRLVIRLLVLPFLLTLFGGGCARESRAPNVLLVMIDSLRADHVHAYGYPRETTPTLDALAREGVRFEHVSSPTSWTLPASATLLTGLPPERHGVIHARMHLTPEAVTLAEVLRDAGFATAGFAGGPYLRREHGLAQGFDEYDESVAALDNPTSHQGRTSPKLVALASAWLDRWADGAREKPFFLFLHLWDVHYDYTPPPPYDTRFDPDYTGAIDGRRFIWNDAIRADMDARDLEHVVALYDGEIRYTDHHLGLMLDRIDALGLRDDTVVVVTADHGDEFFEHGNKGHRATLYEESTKVPLVIRAPGRVATGSVVSTPVRVMDIAPTILGLAGVTSHAAFGFDAPREDWRAHDLTPTIRGGRDLPALLAFGDLEGSLVSVRSATHKLVAHNDRPVEVYALGRDRGELHDISESEPALRAELYRELAEWRLHFEGRPTFAGEQVLDPAAEARLRALGYLD